MKVLLTCGAGDFIAIEGWLAVWETHAVTEIAWATPAQKLIMPLADLVFPNLVKHETLVSNWGEAGGDDSCIETGELLSENLGRQSWEEDWSIGKIVAQASDGKREYKGSSLMGMRLCWPPDIPKPYIAIHPVSSNAPTSTRDMDEKDWRATTHWLKRHGWLGGALGTNPNDAPTHPHLYNLMGQTSLLESLEITKQAAGFIGCASVLSVMAAASIPERCVRIKGNSTLRDEYQWFYYPTAKRSVVYPHIRNIPAYAIP